MAKFQLHLLGKGGKRPDNENTQGCWDWLSHDWASQDTNHQDLWPHSCKDTLLVESQPLLLWRERERPWLHTVCISKHPFRPLNRSNESQDRFHDHYLFFLCWIQYCLNAFFMSNNVIISWKCSKNLLLTWSTKKKCNKTQQLDQQYIKRSWLIL